VVVANLWDGCVAEVEGKDWSRILLASAGKGDPVFIYTREAKMNLRILLEISYATLYNSWFA
jgi:hypothetical protein